MNTNETIAMYGKYVMPTYTKYPLAISRGKGSRVWDNEGKEYLDFFPGWGVGGLGHNHSVVVKAIKKQAGKLIHIANNYYHDGQALLAKELISQSFSGKVFFCNSGAEANEGAIKLARKFGNSNNPQRNEIITMGESFHGRTIATATATGQKRIGQGFEPLLPGFTTVPFNDLAALKAAITPRTVAIMLEPIQGEGGVRIADKTYLAAVRTLCDEKNILLIFDEIQTGMGRTGEMFCYKNLGVTPDILTLAKSLGGGFPIGAFIAKAEIADTLQPGTHGSTFAGSPLACAAALATFEAIEKGKLLEKAEHMGAYLMKKLNALKKKHAVIREVRGVGLMVGVELTVEGKKIYEECLKSGLLINCTQAVVLRIMPPLIVKKKEIDQAIAILDEAFTRCT